MRKESIGRLLLSLLTAFVMVAGVFGAAVQTWSTTSPMGEESDQLAESGLNMKTGETGDAPVSASDSDSNTIDGQKTGQWLSTSTKNNGDVSQGENYIVTGEITDWENPAADDMIENHGTRAPTLDANGPYGEMPPNGTAYYEGEPVEFDATMSGGSIDDYYFRWEVTGDNNYDVNHFPPAYGGDDTKGVANYIHQYRDNFIGEGLVEAWDGVSYNPITLEGQPLKNSGYETYWYFYEDYITVGWEFSISQSITVDEMRMFDYYYPYYCYYVDIWDQTTASKVATTGYLGIYTTNYMWNSWDITPVTLPPGDYVVSAYVQTYYYYGYFPCCYQDPSDDIITAGNVRYTIISGNNYPTTSVSDSRTPLVSFHYEYPELEPALLEANCDIFVDNRAPIALWPSAIGEPGQEGSEIGFEAYLWDAGEDDDWMSRWDFGDGEVSDWIPVNKWAGGARLAFLNALSSMGDATYTAIDAELGNRARVFDNINIEGSIPTLETLMQYDAVLVAAWGFPSDCDELGDVLADYSDAGGGVVQCAGTFWPPPGSPPNMGVLGRWWDEEYNAIEYTNPEVLTRSLGVYDPSHPIMNGVSTITSMVNHPSYALTTYSYWVASYTDTTICVAATEDSHHGIPDSGRIVAFNSYINQPTYVTGDALRLIANALMWASRQPEPYPQSMPIQLDPVYHVYKDDHPTSVTPEDIFNVRVEIRDDDHGRVIGGAGADFDGHNYALTPQAVATHGGGGVGVWGPDRLNNGDRNGTYNDCWTTASSPNNWNQLEWPSPVTIGGCKDYWTRWRPTLSYMYALKEFDIQWWDGSTWVTDQHVDDGQPTTKVDHVITFTAPITTTMLRYSNMRSKAGPPYNIMIQEWEVFGILPGGESYEMFGLSDPEYTTCLIKNVFPVADNAKNVVLHQDENTPINFEGFKIVDPAKSVETEDFRYRWDFDDGTPIGPWKSLVGSGVMYEDFETGTGWPWTPWVEFGPGTQVTTAAAHDGYYGLELDDLGMTGYAYRTDLLIGNAGDRLSYWARPSGNGNGGRAYLGFGASSTGTYSFTLGYNTNEIIIHNSNPYGAFTIVASTSFSGWQANKWYRAEIEFISTTEVTCRLFDSDGTTLLAEVSASGITGLPGGISARGFYLWSVDTIDTGGEIQKIPDIEHNFMDNGKYFVHLELIDDDMKWDFSSGDPVFTGTGLPGDTEEDWTGGTVFVVEIDNTDPVITPKIRAYAELDLSIRMSGTKTHEATMTLYENDVEIGYTEVTRVPGAPNIGVISNVDLMVTKGFEYEIEIVVDPKGGGGSNPTWLFDMVFPDGKFKEFKHTFNDEHGWSWTITDSMLKGALLGHDIIFEAKAEDRGSDDLAFVWNFGDSTPYGIHLYANNNQGTAVDAVSDEATVIFDQLGIDPDPNVGRDAAFDKDANDVRTPYGTSIYIVDSISHVFDENQPYYYYVHLTVMDDDVYDDYPSMQLPHGTGLDIAVVEIDLR